MIIFSEIITERLIYTFNFIFVDRNIDYKITNDKAQFIEAKGSKLNFSKQLFTDTLQIIPSTFLFDESLIPYEMEKGLYEGEDCLKFNGEVDIFASIFYCLSRFEEYGSNQRDVHERYVSKFSLQSKFGWSDKCICDRWSEKVIAIIEEKTNMQLFPVKPAYSYLASFDIDNTFAFQWKNNVRQIASRLREILQKDHARIQARKLFKLKLAKDPYDTFEFIKTLQKQKINTLIFWHLGNYSKYDNNIHWQDLRHQKLIKTLCETIEIGIHPSYKSNLSPTLLQEEKDRLTYILDQENQPEKSRQHFLKLQLPHTYRKLIKANLLHDYTMGYADCIGFRAGTARSHPFFDIEKNQITKLIIHPFSYMDGTLNEYLKLSPIDAQAKIKEIVNEVKQFGGEFICIWHNETIGDFGKWKGWKTVLEYSNRIGNV
jgi:hypothetical protein